MDAQWANSTSIAPRFLHLSFTFATPSHSISYNYNLFSLYFEPFIAPFASCMEKPINLTVGANFALLPLFQTLYNF